MPRSRKNVKRWSFRKFPYACVAVIGPHPDDCVLGCGGLTYRLRESRPDVRVCNLVMTPGFRGVENQYLLEHKQAARKSVADWLALPAHGQQSDQELIKAVKKKIAETASFDRFGDEEEADEDQDCVRLLNVVKTAIRREESRHEAQMLHLDVEKDWRFLCLLDLYQRRIVPRELSELRKHLGEIRVPGKKNLMLIPHPKDPQSAHNAATEIALAAWCPDGEGEEIDWDVWYYQSPWFPIPPDDVNVVVSLDEADINIKKAAAAVHRSQLARTPYADFVESTGRINADLLPELLLGFGEAKFQEFGKYCEVYQVRMRRFYCPQEPPVVVYQDAELVAEQIDHPLNLVRAVFGL